MNSIPQKQNAETQLQRLAAQRQLYGTAKKVFGAALILCGPVAVFWAILVLLVPSLKGFGALWGISVTLCDIFWLTPWQKRLRERAARVQELFDCDVLSLQWNDLKAGKRPAPELVKEQADAYQKWAHDMPMLENWYSPAVADLPMHIARMACQRSNCYWDSKQRRHYADCVIAVVIIVFFLFLVIASNFGMTIEDFVLKVAAPLAPVLLLGIRQFSEHREAANRLDNLTDHAETLWNAALDGKPDADVTAGSRNLQDEILEGRKRSPAVFDFIFKRLRTSFEAQMNHGVEHFIAEAKKKLGTPLP